LIIKNIESIGIQQSLCYSSKEFSIQPKGIKGHQNFGYKERSQYRGLNLLYTSYEWMEKLMGITYVLTFWFTKNENDLG
jgi:hypothetical protein